MYGIAAVQRYLDPQRCLECMADRSHLAMSVPPRGYRWSPTRAVESRAAVKAVAAKVTEFSAEEATVVVETEPR